MYLRYWWMPARQEVVTSSSSPQRRVWTEDRWPGVTWMFLLLTPHLCPACPHRTSSSRPAPPTHPREKTSLTSEELVSKSWLFFYRSHYGNDTESSLHITRLLFISTEWSFNSIITVVTRGHFHMQSHHFNVTLINWVLTSGLYNLMQDGFVAIVEMRGLAWI